jgi:hypothetical protein
MNGWKKNIVQHKGDIVKKKMFIILVWLLFCGTLGAYTYTTFSFEIRNDVLSWMIRAHSNDPNHIYDPNATYYQSYQKQLWENRTYMACLHMYGSTYIEDINEPCVKWLTE